MTVTFFGLSEERKMGNGRFDLMFRKRAFGTGDLTASTETAATAY